MSGLRTLKGQQVSPLDSACRGLCCGHGKRTSCLALGWACPRPRPDETGWTGLAGWQVALPAPGRGHTCPKSLWTQFVDECGETQRLNSLPHSSGAEVCQEPPPGGGTVRGSGRAPATRAAAPSALEGQVWDRPFLLRPEFAWQALRGRGGGLRLTLTSHKPYLPGVWEGHPGNRLQSWP